MLVALHGFTQTSESWRPTLSHLLEPRTTVRVDLPGHGGSTDVDADLERTVDLVVELVGELAGDEPFDLVGYSLGGRVALHAACRAPHQLRRVIAISASPGLRDDDARSARLSRDVALADELERTEDLDGFLARWLANPMFATLPKERAGLGERASNSARGLASSLRRCSLGTQRDLRDELARTSTPTLLLAGSRDDPFVASSVGVASRSAHVHAAVVPGAGHALHLEQPLITAAFIDAFLPAP